MRYGPTFSPRPTTGSLDLLYNHFRMNISINKAVNGFIVRYYKEAEEDATHISTISSMKEVFHDLESAVARVKELLG